VRYVNIALPAGALLLTCLVVVHLSAADVLAADSSGDWRPTFDLVMRWVNFLILALLLIKFSRAPIKKFFERKKQDIADEIGALEAEKDEMLRKIAETKKQLEKSQERLSGLKKRIIARGEKNQQMIIQAAEQESQLLLKSARQKINSRIIEALQELKSELVDAAIELAAELLPQQITEADNQKFIDVFMSSTSSK